MQIVEIKISELKDYEKNAKLHDKKQIDLLAKNIERFGFTTPVLINKNNVVIAGHGRILAMKQLGKDSVPCVKMEKLSEKECNALRLADNQINAMTGFDMGLVIEDLKGLDVDLLDLTGFDRYLLDLDNIENVEVGYDQLGVITFMPPESPKLKEKAVLYIDNIDDYKKVKEAILNGEIGVNEILQLL